MKNADYLLSASAFGQLVARCRQAAPQEACGLAAASADDPCGIVTCILPLRNCHPDPLRHYRLDPAEWIEAHYRLVRSGLRLIAVYHSHPRGPAAPSEEDAARRFGPAPRAPKSPSDSPKGLACGSYRWKTPPNRKSPLMPPDRKASGAQCWLK